MLSISFIMFVELERKTGLTKLFEKALSRVVSKRPIKRISENAVVVLNIKLKLNND